MSARAVLLFGLAAAGAWAAESPRTEYWIETVVGGQNSGDGGPALTAQLSAVQGVAADRFGNVYLSDTDHHRVRKVSAAGIITTVAGTGVAGAAGDGGPAGAAQLQLPYGLAIDTAGNLFIADLGNHRVRRVGTDGVIRTVAGAGQKGWSGDGGPATAAQLMAPRNVAVDTAGTLYVSEFEGHRIRIISPGGAIATLAGTGLAGFSGDGGPAARAQLSYPAGLALDGSGALLVADSGNRRIRRIAADGSIATLLGGTAETPLFQPTGLAADPYGNVYVTELTATVRRFTPAAAVIASIAGTGQPGFSGDGGPARSARLAAPHDVAVDAAGNIWIADDLRVRRADHGGVILTIAGDAFQSALGDGAPAWLASLYYPGGLAMDPAGNLYIADSGTRRVRKVAPQGLITSAAGGDPGAAAAEISGSAPYRLNRPMGVWAAAGGAVFIADTYDHRVFQIDAAGGLAAFAGSGVAGIGPEDAPATATALRGPQAVIADGSGTVYIADTGNHRVVAVNRGRLRTIAGNGTAGYAGDGGLAAGSQLNSPSGLAWNAAGELYIADTGNHRIRKLTRDGGIATVAGSGSAGFSGDAGPAASAKLNAPRGVAVDGDGCLYIADTANHRIRKVSADGIIETIAGGETAGLAGDGGPAVQAQLDAPGAVLVDGSGHVYLSDSRNHRVRRLSPMVLPAPLELPREAAVLNAASREPGAVAPGELLAIETSESGAEPQVLFDGEPAPLFPAEGELRCQAPYSLEGRASTEIEIRYRGAAWVRLRLPVAPAAPGVYATMLNQDGTVNTAETPAARGSLVVLFATGEGAHEPPLATGRPPLLPISRPVLPVSLTIAGAPAAIEWAGASPVFPGLFQINARVPSGYVPAGRLPVVLMVGSLAAPAATLAVR